MSKKDVFDWIRKRVTDAILGIAGGISFFYVCGLFCKSLGVQYIAATMGTIIGCLVRGFD